MANIQCDLFVGAGGDDAKDGTTVANRKATIQAALTAVGAGGGVKVAIEAGVWNEYNLSPANPGASGSYNELIGDTDPDNRLVDAGSNTFANDAGPVVLDAVDTTNGIGRSGYNNMANSANWSHWHLKDLILKGGQRAIWLSGVTASMDFTRVWAIGSGALAANYPGNVTLDSGGAWNFNQCGFWNTFAGTNARAIQFIFIAAAMPETPQIIFNCCRFIMHGAGQYITYNYGLSEHYTYGQFNNCTFEGGNSFAIYGGATYSKTELIECTAYRTDIPPTADQYVYTGNIWLPWNDSGTPPTGWTKKTDSSGFLPCISRPFEKIGSGGSEAGYDLTGLAKDGSIGDMADPGKRTPRPGSKGTAGGMWWLPERDASGGGTGRVGVMRVLGGR